MYSKILIMLAGVICVYVLRERQGDCQARQALGDQTDRVSEWSRNARPSTPPGTTTALEKICLAADKR